MEVAAKLSQARVSPQKARLVADQIRGLPVEQAIDILTFSVKKSADMIKKLVHSAIHNAEFNNGMDIDELKVARIFVDAGPVLKRIQPRAKGRANRIIKRTCHITVVVSDSQEIK